MSKHYTLTGKVFFLFALNLFFASTFIKAQSAKSQPRTQSEAPWSDAEKAGIKAELVTKRNQFSKSFTTTDGQVKMYTSPASIHYLKNGAWHEIDPTIIPNNSGTHTNNPYYNGENSFKTFYPNNPINGKVITTLKEGEMTENIEAVYAEDQNGNNVYQFQQNTTQDISVTNGQISYKNVFPNASVQYSQQNDGRKFDLKLESSQFLNAIPASAKYLVIKEKMTIPANWTITETANGYDVYQGGLWLANYPKPVAYEKQSPSKVYDEDADYMNEGSMSIVKNGNQITVFTKFALKWLRSNNRSYPVMLDPTIICYPNPVSMATGRSIGTAAKVSGYMRCGNSVTATSGGVVWARFNTSAVPSGATISAATYYGNHYSGTGADKIVAIVGMQSVDPMDALVLTGNIATQITNGPSYNTTYIFGGAVIGWHTGAINATGLSAIQGQLGNGWTAFGFKYLSGNGAAMIQYGYDAAVPANIPYLEITYSSSGCTTAFAGAASSDLTGGLACGSAFNLNLALASTGSGTVYQWQKSAVGANTWTNLGGPQATPLYNTTQSVATDYRCYVVCATASSSDTSTVLTVGQNTLAACYAQCTPSGIVGSTNYIYNVTTTGGVVNFSNTSGGYTSNPVGYGDFTNFVVAANQGASINLSVQFYSGSHAIAVWVDWNQDGDFADAGETMFPGSSLAATFSFPMTIPATATFGNTRMRIRNSTSVLPVACGYNATGETEDYTINVLGPCSSATVASITPTSYIICPLTTQALSATVPIYQNGITYQWQSSTTSGGPYSDIVGATNLAYTTIPLPTGTYYYVLKTTCANCTPSVCTALSNEISILSQNVTAPIATNSSQCAPGVPLAYVTSGAGAIGTGNFNWYSAASGGTLLQSKPYGPLVPYYFNDFSTTALGTLGSIYSNASVTGGSVQLFPNLTSQYGALQVDSPGFMWDKMQADFDLTTSGTTPANMADGVSFSFGPDAVPTAEAAMNAENGSGSRVKLCFVAYSNGTSTQGIYLMYNNTVNEPASAPVSTSTTLLAYSTDVSWKAATKHITFFIDSLGKATLSVGGVVIFNQVQLPTGVNGYTAANIIATRPKWKFVLKGRTGALTMGANIDNLDIKLSTLVTGSTTYLSSISTTQTFYVAELGTNGCYSPRTPVTATVNTPPTISINPIPNDSVCTGAPVTLSGSGASTYSWNGIPTLTSDTTFTSAIAGIYTVTGTDVNGCSNTSTVLIYLHPVLSGTATATPNAVCLGSSVNLTATATPICTGLYTPNFVGYYTPSLWTFTNVGTNGTSNFTGAPANIKLSTGAPAVQSGTGVTKLSRVITCSGNVSFSWSFLAQDQPNLDYPQYSINGGAPVIFPGYDMFNGGFGSPQVGTLSIPLNSGDLLSIEVVTDDNDPLSGTLTVTNFNAPSPKITGSIAYWTAASGGTNLGAPPLTVTPTTAGTTTYYAEYTSNTTGCPNLVREPATVTVYDIPTATVSGGDTVCAGSPLPNVNIALTGVAPWNIVYSNGTTSIPVNGITTSPYVITNAPQGIYSVTSINDAHCTGTTSGSATVTVYNLPTATVSGGGTVCPGSTLPNVSVALTGANSWNLTYTDGTAPVTVNGITTSPYTIPGSIGNFSIITVNDIHCSNTGSGSASVANYTSPTVTASMTPNSICNNGTAVATGGGAVSYVWDNGIQDNTPFVATASGTYNVIGTDVNSCTSTASVTLTVNGPNSNLSLATSGNTSSNNGTQSGNNTQPDASTVLYSDPSCNMIATVADAAGGNSLGNTVATVTVENTVMTYPNPGGQPYSRRWYQITPTNNVGVNAIVTLYQTQDDFDDYNAASAGYPQLPIDSSDAAGIANIAVTKVSGGTLGVGTSGIVPISVFWNSANHYWEITINVTGTFSQFYVHGVNANPNSPLPATIASFTGHQAQNADVLTWITSSEQNNSHFNLQYSTDGIHFETISTVYSKATAGNSTQALQYGSRNETPVNGHNYYRLQQVDIDGRSVINTQIVDLVRANTAAGSVNVYPNPVKSVLSIDLFNSKASHTTIKIMDLSGRTVKEVQTDTQNGMNSLSISTSELSAGLYTIQVAEDNHVLYVGKIRKEN